MQKVRQQFGVATVDGKERKYCHITVEIGNNDEGISKMCLSEQFKLLAENFWLYIKAQEEAKINRSLFDADGNIELKKGWF